MTSPSNPRQRFRRVYARAVFYPTLGWNMLLGRWLKIRHWWDHVDPQVILGARPFASDVDRLHQEGVSAVVNTCEEYVGPVEEYARFGIEQLHIPTTDFTAPSIEDIESAVAFIQSRVEDGETVYVHCKAGRARSATIALCWLVKHRGLTPQQAQQQLLRCRPHVHRRLPERQVVQGFVRRLENPPPIPAAND